MQATARTASQRARALIAAEDRLEAARQTLSAIPARAANRQQLQDDVNQAASDLADEKLRQAEELMASIGQRPSVTTANTNQGVSLAKRTGLKIEVEKFHGLPDKDEDPIELWIADLTELLESSDCGTDQDKLAMLPRYLSGTAKRWFRQNRSQFVTWADLVDSLTKRFELVNQRERILERIEQLKQTASVRKYCQLFDKLLDRYPEVLSERDIIRYFKRGLKKDPLVAVECLLRTKPDAPYSEVASVAEQVGEVAWQSQRTENGRGIGTRKREREDSGESTTRPKKQTMKIGALKAALEQGNVPEELRCAVISAFQSGVTKGDKDGKTKDKKCYGCGATGHLFADCPKKYSAAEILAINKRKREYWLKKQQGN